MVLNVTTTERYRVDYDDGDCEEYNFKDAHRMVETALAQGARDPKVTALLD